MKIGIVGIGVVGAAVKHGFESVKRYDWRKTDHSHVDDYS
jgi:hypothetical protein